MKTKFESESSNRKATLVTTSWVELQNEFQLARGGGVPKPAVAAVVFSRADVAVAERRIQVKMWDQSQV